LGVPTSSLLVQGLLHLIRSSYSGIVVAVLSNIAHANKSSLGLKVGDAFAKQAR
jgi:hypothetical protein